jgi:hypothetical protein
MISIGDTVDSISPAISDTVNSVMVSLDGILVGIGDSISSRNVLLDSSIVGSLSALDDRDALDVGMDLALSVPLSKIFSLAQLVVIMLNEFFTSKDLRMVLGSLGLLCSVTLQVHGSVCKSVVG